MNGKMIVFDGNSILNRAYYGVRPLNTKDGFPTNALFGFVNILQKNLAPGYDYAAIAYDLREKTFRHIRCDTYKATRRPMPEDLAKQLPVSKEIAELMGLHVLTAAGFEADDILGTLSRIAKENDVECVIVTGDRDSYQLVCDGVTVHLAANNETRIIDTKAIDEMYGLTPSQLIDLKAVMGDSSDNISGVPGIGEKGALELMHQYGSLDGIYAHIDEIKGSKKTKLENGRKDAYMSRFLAEISKSAPVPENIEEYRILPRNDGELISLFTKLEFTSLIGRLSLEKPAKPEKAVEIRPLDGDAMTALPDGIYAETDGKTVRALHDGVIYTCPLAECSRLFSAGRRINFWSLKETARAVLDAGFEFGCDGEDVSLLAYVVSPVDSGLTVEKAAAMYLDMPSVTESLSILPGLYDVLTPKLMEANGEFIYRSIELPLARVLADMEHTGFRADEKGLEAFSEMCASRLAVLEREIYAAAGEEFNINSPKQLGTVLFEKLMLPPPKKTKTGYPTDAETLEKLAPYSPIINLIFGYRQLAKLKSTYSDGLRKCISSDGRIHTTFRHTLTKTGRLSSVEPNLQNIPIRTELGRELRKFFVAEDGWTLIDADYSQIELRILAHVAGDENLKKAFREEKDIHTATAAEIFRIPEESVTPELRKRAKAVNFGIMYGISAFGLAKDIGVSKREADEYIKHYMAAYPAISEYLKNVVTDAKRDGYVSTIYGRRRYIPEINSSKKMLVSFAERVARNTPIQGAAADIIKKAMVDTAETLKKAGLRSRLILQIHDELIVEAPENEKEQAAQILKSCMENAFPLDVPLTVDMTEGKSWEK